MTSVSVVRHMDYHKQLKMIIILLIANSKTVKSILSEVKFNNKMR